MHDRLFNPRAVLLLRAVVGECDLGGEVHYTIRACGAVQEMMDRMQQKGSRQPEVVALSGAFAFGFVRCCRDLACLLPREI
jgi:hypothetical protein